MDSLHKFDSKAFLAVFHLQRRTASYRPLGGIWIAWRAWYRVIYTIQVKGKIYVLHCFKKQSAKTSKTDLELAKSRLKQI